MKKVILAMLALVSSPAFAHDSLWTLCEGKTLLFGDEETILVNQYEHRSGAATRATELTLIFGSHILSGSFDSTSRADGPVRLSQGTAAFAGTVRVGSTSIELNGNLDLGRGNATPVAATLACRTIRD